MKIVGKTSAGMVLVEMPETVLTVLQTFSEDLETKAQIVRDFFRTSEAPARPAGEYLPERPAPVVARRGRVAGRVKVQACAGCGAARGTVPWPKKGALCKACLNAKEKAAYQAEAAEKTKPCVVCGKPFKPTTCARTCSPECRAVRERKHKADYLAKKAKAQGPMRAAMARGVRAAAAAKGNPKEATKHEAGAPVTGGGSERIRAALARIDDGTGLPKVDGRTVALLGE